MHQTAGKRNLPSGTQEILPLVIGIVGISIPVVLIAVASSGKNTFVLVLALVAMLVVGAATLAFILLLTSDSSDESSHGDEAHGESQAVTAATPQS